MKKSQRPPGIRANSVTLADNVATVDVRGQTCPGYLLAINKAVGALPPGTTARLLISYPPCGDDVRTWCRLKDIEFVGITISDGLWVIEVRK